MNAIPTTFIALILGAVLISATIVGGAGISKDRQEACGRSASGRRRPICKTTSIAAMPLLIGTL